MADRRDNEGPPFQIDGMPCDVAYYSPADAIKEVTLPASAAPFPRIIRQETATHELVAYWLFRQPDAPPTLYQPAGQLEPAP